MTNIYKDLIDSNGNIIRRVLPNGIVDKYSYDSKGRMTYHIRSDGYEEGWHYKDGGVYYFNSNGDELFYLLGEDT